jgi:hypothetical protein
MSKGIRAVAILVILWFMGFNSSLAEEVTLVYTGSTHAMLYPCRCPLEADGGVARRATLIKELRKEDPNLILLDSGNFFAAGLLDENTINTQADMERTIINLRAMELMKYDGLNLSEDEFNFGEKFFRENADKFKLRFISANLESDKISPYIIKESKGIKFGIIGLTNNRVKNKIKDIRVVELISALKKSVTELKAKGVDFIILLSNLGEEEDARLVGEITGVDVIIDGQINSKEKASFKLGNTIVLRPVWQGRRLGKAVLNIQDKKIAGYKAEEIRLSDKVPADSEIAAILPQCFSDNECKKSGFIGACKDAGTSKANCSFKEVLKVRLTVILSKDCSICDPEPMVEFLKKKFLSLNIKYLHYPQRNASDLIKKLGIDGLPVFILGKEADKAEGFNNFKENLEAKGEFYVVRPEAGGISYFLNRKKEKGRLDVFLSLYDKNTPKILEVIKEFNPIIHLLAVKQGDKFDAPNGISEVEEDLRAVCVQKYYPDTFNYYLSCRSKNINSSWWDDCLKGVDTKKIRTCARGGEGALLLEENTRLNSEIKVMFGPTYLLGNKEIFSSNGAPDKEELRKIIKR